MLTDDGKNEGTGWSDELRHRFAERSGERLRVLTPLMAEVWIRAADPTLLHELGKLVDELGIDEERIGGRFSSVEALGLQLVEQGIGPARAARMVMQAGQALFEVARWNGQQVRTRARVLVRLVQEASLQLAA